MYKHKLQIYLCLFVFCLNSYCTRQIKQLVWVSSSRSINCIQYVGVLCECVCVFESLQPVDVVGCYSHIYLNYLLGICCCPTTHSFCSNRLISIDEVYVEIRNFEKLCKHRVASLCLLINDLADTHTHTLAHTQTHA